MIWRGLLAALSRPVGCPAWCELSGLCDICFFVWLLVFFLLCLHGSLLTFAKEKGHFSFEKISYTRSVNQDSITYVARRSKVFKSITPLGICS
jgi:hypothetical protein